MRKKVRTYRLSKGKEQETLYLISEDETQPELWTARVGTTTFEVNIPRASYVADKPEPFEVFATMRPAGFFVEVCATCSHFRFSGYMRSCSGGSRGYCFEGDRPAEGWPTVEVDYYCGYHTFQSEDGSPDLTREE